MQQSAPIDVTSATPAAPYKVGNFGHGQSRHDLSTQWLSRPRDQRYLSLGDLKAAVDARRERSKERRTDTKDIEFLAPADPTRLEQMHELTIGLKDGTELAPSHYTFGQLCGLAKAPAPYLRTIPSQIVADALTYSLRYNREADAVKLYSTDDMLAAATGPDYGRIYDSEVVEAVMQVAGNGDGKDSRWKVPGRLDWSTSRYDPEAPVTIDTTTLFASDRDSFIFLVDDRNPIEIGKLPNGDPDLVFRGFFTRNSEVGHSSLILASFYLRAICDNRILWGVEGFEELRMRHNKYAPARFIEEARPALESFANGSEYRLIEGVRKAKEAKVALDEVEALEWLASRKFSRSNAFAILEAVEREEGHPARSAWDMAQGITAVARQSPNTDTRFELESEARKILDKVAA